MDKELPLDGHTLQPDGWVLVHNTGAKEQANLLEPGQVLAEAPTAMLIVVRASEVPSETQWLMDFVAVGGLCHHSQRPGTHLYS